MCDSPTLYEEVQRKSRKEHRCTECGCTIKKGVMYYDIKGLWDGEWGNYKAHKDCHELYVMLYRNFIDYGEPYAFDELITAIVELLDSNLVASVIGGSTWTEENISLIKAKYEMSLL